MATLARVARTMPKSRRLIAQARRREGRYLLRSNLSGEDLATLWRYYLQLTEIKQAFKKLKHDLAIRPVFHLGEERTEAHIFAAFIAYCLHVTLKNLTQPRRSGCPLQVFPYWFCSTLHCFSARSIWTTTTSCAGPYWPRTVGLRAAFRRGPCLLWDSTCVRGSIWTGWVPPELWGVEWRTVEVTSHCRTCGACVTEPLCVMFFINKT